jgi:HEAT repeat protein
MPLKKRWLAILALAAVCVVGGLLLARRSQPLLMYEGKSVEQWSVQLYTGSQGLQFYTGVQLHGVPEVPDQRSRDAAAVALKALGVKAVPGLIQMLREKDPFFRRQMWSLSPKLPLGFRRQIVKRLTPLHAEFAHISAMRAIGVIGPDAREAIPELERALQGRGLQESWEASNALGSMGPEAVRVLVPALHSEFPAVIQAALAGLKQIGPAAGQAVPSVIEKLGHRDPSVRMWAVSALSGIGQPAVPQLLQTVERGNGEVRRGAAQALTQIYPSRRKLTPAFLQMLKDEEAASRLQAIESLRVIHASDEATIRAMTNALQDTDLNVREAASNTLAGLGAKN